MTALGSLSAWEITLHASTCMAISTVLSMRLFKSRRVQISVAILLGAVFFIGISVSVVAPTISLGLLACAVVVVVGLATWRVKKARSGGDVKLGRFELLVIFGLALIVTLAVVSRAAAAAWSANAVTGVYFLLFSAQAVGVITAIEVYRVTSKEGRRVGYDAVGWRWIWICSLIRLAILLSLADTVLR